MTNDPEIPFARASGQSIATNLHCTQCGYNLRGLTLVGICPECGASISLSTMGNHLRYLNPKWINQLRLGVVLMLWYLFLYIFVRGRFTFSINTAGYILHHPLIGMLHHGLGLWAIFLITMPEPSVQAREKRINWRETVRVCAICGFLQSVVTMVSASISSSLLMVSRGIFILVGYVAFIGTFVVLRRLARKLPDDRLVSSTSIVMWGFLFTFGFTLLSVFLVYFMSGTASITLTTNGVVSPGSGPFSPSGWMWLGGIGFITIISYLVFSIWYIVVLFRYHAAFKWAYQAAMLQHDWISIVQKKLDEGRD